jgi:GNAT superfamily N-acetyltransferase
MARYEVPTPSTLLLRMVAPEHAGAARRMLDEAAPVPREAFRIATLADVSSDSSMAPLAAAVVHHRPGEPTAWIARLVVSMPFRRRGLGRRLLADISRALQAEGAQRLWIQAGDGDPAVRALLAGAGFVTGAAAGPAAVPPGSGSGEDDPRSVWWLREL